MGRETGTVPAREERDGEPAAEVGAGVGADAKGFPVRDPDSSSFVGAVEEAEVFGWRLCGEALRRGLTRVERVVVIADGAEWIRNLTEFHFPRALRIVEGVCDRARRAALNRHNSEPVAAVVIAGDCPV